MSAINFTLDTSRMDKALREYMPTTKKDLSEIVNQRTLNVNGRAFDHLPPHGNIQAQRNKVRAYLRQPISTRVKMAKSGKRKGQFIRKGARNKQLQVVHLVVQARRARDGKKGLFGKAMLQAAGAFVSQATNSVGFLKSVFLPIITALNPMVKFKFPFSKTSRISRWPGSAGYGKATPAAPGWSPTATFAIGMRLRRFKEEPKVQGMLAKALQHGLNAEAAELERHTARKLQETANRYNAR